MILTLDCEGSAQLSSDSLDRNLNWYERVAVSLHCMICKKSRILDRQIVELGKKIDQIASDKLEANGLSTEAKARILNRVSQAEPE